MGDVEPKIDDKNFLIKFKLGRIQYFQLQHLRPETIFGITNLWVNPNTIYKKFQLTDEKWIVSEECAKKIEFFEKRSRDYRRHCRKSEIIGKQCH